MMNADINNRLNNLTKRAAVVRTDSLLRYEPNAHDLRIAGENVKDMALPQYQTIAPNRKNDK
jgi:hypothetical protein